MAWRLEVRSLGSRREKHKKKTAATFNDEEFLWEKWQMLCRMNKPLPLCVCVMGSVRRIVCLEWFSV